MPGEKQGAGRLGPQLKKLFGWVFISNPDLPRRLQQGAPLNPFDVDTFYVPGAKGYVDHRYLDMAAA